MSFCCGFDRKNDLFVTEQGRHTGTLSAVQDLSHCTFTAFALCRWH